MNVELVNTGTELLLGRVLNTHQQWLGRRLADLGLPLLRQVAVPDTADAIEEAVREALGRADLVLTTGGLGPTSDDLTRERIAGLLGRGLREDPEILEHIRSFFAARQRPMPERTRLQALVIEGAQVLPNRHGTAPGMALCLEPNPFGGERAWLIMLPGPPREMRPMFDKDVAPLLKGVCSPLPSTCLTLRTTGIGESVVEEKIGSLLVPLVAGGLALGYCARPGQVDVRLSACGADGVPLVEEAARVVRSCLEPFIYGTEDEELEEVLVRELTRRGETLAVAESCTGGNISHRLTNVPGASAVFLAGIAAYSNPAKMKFLGVRKETLEEHGAVSEAVAREMAEGARLAIRATYALSTTGIAGPTGGSVAKPVGTVYVGLSGPSGTSVERFFNPWERETFKQVTASQALDLLRRRMVG